MLVEQETIRPSAEWINRLADARQRTDQLFAIVNPDALYDRPIPERHRIVFYLGHVEAFDWNLLRDRLLKVSAFDPQLDRLFAFGIDPVDGQLPSDKVSDWPSIEAVRQYVSRIRSTIDNALAASDFSDSTDAGLLLNVAIEHRLMHAETLAYMLHQLPLNRKMERKTQTASDPIASAVRATPEMIKVPQGTAVIGLSRSDGLFGWDNEFEAHSVEVPPFTMDRYKITNGQFLEFMAAGGYENSDLWTKADWTWKAGNNISSPSFWQRVDGEWYLRTMFDEIPLPLDWPVYVSHAEASAYACWAGKSLPTEEQWHRAAYGTPRETPEGGERPYPWGSASPSARFGNFDFQRWDPAPVGAFPEGQSAFGLVGMLGNGWEWTRSVFVPFAGFEKFPFYPGYSADFFDGKHYVMKGGSARTAACMLRKSFRNWFQPHYGYVYSGFRCVTE
jgi:gamma-glutamyl hercynylcysteine S-oxide synthase